MPRIVCLADVHNRTNFTVPPGDILVVAGDLTGRGSVQEVSSFLKWLADLPHQHKIIIAGNHDFLFEQESGLARAMVKSSNCIYLQDSAVTVEGLKIWGSPWQPWFYDWAFNLERGPDIKKYWDLIPEDIDILLTHGPPHGILDRTVEGAAVGCEELIKVVSRIKPKLHVFGHIHHSYGMQQQDGTIFVNASVCNEKYQAVNPVQVVEINRGK